MKKEKQPLTYQILSKYRGVLMGVSIIFIIYFHYLNDVKSGGIKFSTIQRLIYHYIGSANVDIFILVSGLGLYFSMKKNRDLLHFYKRRFTRILIPYTLVAGPAIYWRQVIFYNKGIKDFLKFFLVPLSNRWFWYIGLICFCYLIFPYVFEMFENAQNRLQEHMYVMMVFTSVIVFAMLLKEYATGIFDKGEIALLRVPWFFVGCLLGKASYEKRKIGLELPMFMIGSFVILRLREYDSYIFSRNIMTCLNLCLCFILIFALEELSRVRILMPLYKLLKTTLDIFGKYSLELYLTHVAIRRVMLEFKLPMHDIRYEALMVILSMIVSFFLKPISEFLEKRIINLPFWKEA